MPPEIELDRDAPASPQGANTCTEEPAEPEPSDTSAATAATSKTRKRRRKRRMSKRQQDLATRYVPWALALAKPMKEAWPHDADALESAALFALTLAAKAYRRRSRIKFTTFARYRILGAMVDVQRDFTAQGWRARPDTAPLVLQFSAYEEEDGVILGCTPDPPLDEEVENVDFLEYWLTKLPPRHAKVCRYLYIYARSQSQTARAMGYSKTRVSCLHRESLRMLNQTMRWKNRLGEESWLEKSHNQNRWNPRYRDTSGAPCEIAAPENSEEPLSCSS